MPHVNPACLSLPHDARSGDSGRNEGSNTSMDAYDLTHRASHAEVTRSPVSPHEEDLQTAVTYPLLLCAASAAGNDHHHNSASLSIRGVSSQRRSISSPCTNLSAFVSPRWSPHPGWHRRGDDGESVDGSEVSEIYSTWSRHATTLADAVRHVDDASFASAAPVENLNDSPSSPTVAFPAKSPSHPVVRRLLSLIPPSFTAFCERLQSMTWKRILWIVILVALVMVGNFMQIVMLNFWLIAFPSDGTPGNYTAFAVPGIFFAILFVLLLGSYVAVRRPSLRFATHLHGWGILVGIGFCDAINSWMATYAASNTSEVLQALFTNLCPLFAVFLSKWILRDTRRYANVYIASVFVLTILGILAASLYGLIMDRNVSEGKWWILIFFLSMPVRVLMNVWQSLYMVVYTRDANFVSWLRIRFAEETPTAVDAEERTAIAAAAKDAVGDEASNGSLGASSYRHFRLPRDAAAPCPTAIPVKALAAAADDDDDDDDAPAKEVHKHQLSREMGINHSESSPSSTPSSDDDAKALGGELVGDGVGYNHTKENPQQQCNGKSNQKKGRDALDVTSEADSDPAVPIITITAPTPTLQEQLPLQQPQQVCYDRDYRSPPSRKLSPKERPVIGTAGGDGALPPLTHDEPVVPAVDELHEEPAIRDIPCGGREEREGSLSPAAAAAPPLPAQTMFTVRYNQGADTIVKLVMLAGETFIQMCFTLLLLPADALPWWGNSATVADTWGNFKEGLCCVFTIRENFWYCFLYTLGFVFTYVGCAYLNHYSAALCSIVTQLSSPVTALMLVIVPSWNVQDDGDSPWYCSVVAIVFLVIAALLYVLWEEMTQHEKMQAEYALKMEELHVRPSSHARPHAVVMDG
ncbi:hypothetical protein ABL78_7040 [Leptomonas seymouri]|uniref:Transmembrane protein n=1 Tax=Leptomonas seymouri TaxID=5684 RepID=A0A0N1PBN1_LEPSE|nr:hypothetical protein ABL78_7040 [Leptomonas seymouri]|eukprot:KPI83922.1 hypothetical protein ABL78_7040 [Leptomonas seymouri]